MNIGVDLDDTISELPEFFAIVSQALRRHGHKVYIVSYRSAASFDESRREVAAWGIEHDGLFHPVDGERIGAFKSRIASELDLDVFFDDMPEALAEMPPKVKRFWLCDPEFYDLQDVIRSLLP